MRNDSTVMANTAGKWNPSRLPPEIQQALRTHLTSCPTAEHSDCDHVLEILNAERREGATLRMEVAGDMNHLEARQIDLPHTGVPSGLAFILSDRRGELLYGCWLPRRRALYLRDMLLTWFPLTR